MNITHQLLELNLTKKLQIKEEKHMWKSINLKWKEN